MFVSHSWAICWYVMFRLQKLYYCSWNWRLHFYVELDFCRFFEIFEKYDGYKDGHVKLKRPKQLQEILDIARSLLNEIQHRAADPEIEEKQGKLEQLKSVLEMWVFTKLPYTEVEKERNSNQKQNACFPWRRLVNLKFKILWLRKIFCWELLLPYMSRIYVLFDVTPCYHFWCLKYDTVQYLFMAIGFPSSGIGL